MAHGSLTGQKRGGTLWARVLMQFLALYPCECKRPPYVMRTNTRTSAAATLGCAHFHSRRHPCFTPLATLATHTSLTFHPAWVVDGQSQICACAGMRDLSLRFPDIW